MNINGINAITYTKNIQNLHRPSFRASFVVDESANTEIKDFNKYISTEAPELAKEMQTFMKDIFKLTRNVLKPLKEDVKVILTTNEKNGKFALTTNPQLQLHTEDEIIPFVEEFDYTIDNFKKLPLEAEKLVDAIAYLQEAGKGQELTSKAGKITL